MCNIIYVDFLFYKILLTQNFKLKHDNRMIFKRPVGTYRSIKWLLQSIEFIHKIKLFAEVELFQTKISRDKLL